MPAPIEQPWRNKQTSTTTGTGAYTLIAPGTHLKSLAARFGYGVPFPYCAADGSNYEIAIGQLTAGPPDTLSRTTIVESSNAGAAVNWGAGTRDIFAIGPGGPRGFKVFTASGSLVKANDIPAHVTHVIAHVWGGGGSGGAANDSSNLRGTGGAGGGYARKRIAVKDLAASETVTIGAGGAAVNGSATPAAGNAGGTSSLGSHCSATGGAGGAAGVSGSVAGAIGGAGSGGDLNLNGGSSTTKMGSSFDASFDGRGGDAALGVGFGGHNVGASGVGRASGGAAGNHSPAGSASGAGSGGLIIVEW